jgi:TetR/AcrR family transcriptional regulator, cholesterol catabolism regulator
MYLLLLAFSLNMCSTNIDPKKVNLRKAQAEERRLQILDKALTVFASKGFKGTSIKNIAQAAGISQGLMYHYFNSKEALLNATIEHHSFLPQLRKILKDNDNLPLDQVFKGIANGFLNMLEDKQMVVSILLREVDSYPEVSNAWANLLREGSSLLKKYLEARIDTGELRPHNTEAAARSLVSILFMYHYTRKVFQFSQMTRAQFIEEVIKNTLEGIGRE